MYELEICKVSFIMHYPNSQPINELIVFSYQQSMEQAIHQTTKLGNQHDHAVRRVQDFTEISV